VADATGPLDDVRGGRGLSAVAIARPVFTAMMMIALVVIGLYGFRRLNIDQYPQVDIPVVTVQTIYAGASPETIEREVTRRLEEAFNPVEGVDTITSTSLEGVSQVIVQFVLERDVDQAAQDVRARIDSVRRELPENIEEPVVQRFDPTAQPIVSLALASTSLPLPQLTTLADETIRRRLESVQGVGQVTLAGGLERQVRVYLLPQELKAYAIGVPQVMSALAQQNLEVPAGRIETGATEQLVRVSGRITDVNQFARVIVSAARDGTPIRLGQVARVEDATEEERTLALVNDQRAVSLDVVKVSGANTVAVADGVKAAIEEIQPSLPAGTTLRLVRDNSTIIRESVNSVIHELLIGALLTVVIVMLFLNDWKATVITSLALPVSVISAFILIYALGFTLNTLTLMALSLSIGILIDDAIVVVENIVRHREAGEEPGRAARQGTGEIFLAVMATTLTIVAVFVPVAFMGGIVGRFFYQFGLTVAWAVLVSLFVSFTLTPMLAAHWGVGAHPDRPGGRNFVMAGIDRFNRWFDRQADRYRGAIRWALAWRKATIGIAIASLIGAFALFPFIGGGFMPETDDAEFAVQFETPEGSALAYTREKAMQIIAVLRALPGVDYTYTTVGAGATGTVTSGNVYVKLVPPGERARDQAEMMAEARRQLGTVAATDITVLTSGGVGGAAAPIQIEIRGADVDQLQRLSTEVVNQAKTIPGVADVRSTLGRVRPELRIDINRDVANAVGLDIGQIASTVRPVLAGQTATTWEDPSGEERDVVVQVAPEARTSIGILQQLPVSTSRQSENNMPITVPLGEVAQVQEGTAAAQITRKDLQRVGTVTATTTGGLSVGEASSLIQTKLAGLTLPPGYTINLGGETEQMNETIGYVLEALVLAIVLIFLILASQFESVAQPFAIMLSLPLSLIGVLLALFFTNDTLNMMSMIGVIMLMGLVTKNAILLVDNANEHRALGMDRDRALVEAGRARLRPILMTTFAMIVGMLPIALALGEGGGFRAPMARAVIGGLITSTLLTLVVVPVAYTYAEDAGEWIRRHVRVRAVRHART
jgi:HAE1 family hydrophobic/amphiphilic exporter-1